MNSKQIRTPRSNGLVTWGGNFSAVAANLVWLLALVVALTGILVPLCAQNQGNIEFAYTATGSCSCEGQASIPGSVSAYTIDPTRGVLTEIAGSPFPAGTNSHSVAVNPSGRFLYVANHDSNDVSGFAVDSGSGALT